MEWRVIPSNTNYEVSDRGDIRRIGKVNNLAVSKRTKNFTTYLRVTLFDKGKRQYRQVHRLVAEAFIPNPNNLPQVDHIDADGSNNTVANLQWVTASENIKKSFIQNPEKLRICSKGGKLAAVTSRKHAISRYKQILGNRFLRYYSANEINKDGAVTYRCECGIVRTASVMYKELRNHKGKCPICTNTVKKSNPSLL